MLSRLWAGRGKASALKPSKLADPSQHPTLTFQEPPATHADARIVCSRCSTLLFHALTHFGDGTNYMGLKMLHSLAMEDISDAVWMSMTPSSEKSKIDTTKTAIKKVPCIICIRVFIQFQAARSHVAFEKTLKSTPPQEWRLGWEIHSPSNVHAHLALPHDSLRVYFMIEHIGGYGWGIGGFEIYPDALQYPPKNSDEAVSTESPAIVSLDTPTDQANSSPSTTPVFDFSSTLSTGTISLVAKWAQECISNHTKCNNIFGGNHQVPQAAGWFPDRLIRIQKTESSEVFESGQMSSDVTARLVLKSDTQDFTPSQIETGLTYLSLSHCWGKAPEHTATSADPAHSMLTQTTLTAWRTNLPFRKLPLTFQHAIAVCAMLGCEYIWIDSLCIIQDSLDDWRKQSAVMGDVYKYAWLNIAAISSKSDLDGFINDSRDPRVVFGFRTQFGALLKPHARTHNLDGQDCILLKGNAKLLWTTSTDVPGMAISDSPLFKRGWVYQEKHLSRRTIGFTKMGIHWMCDESARNEMSTATDSAAWSALRTTQHLIEDISHRIFTDVQQGIPAPMPLAERQQLLVQLCEAFLSRWHYAITEYTLCKLTKHTDKLIAISSIAREMADTPIFGKTKYLAGLWSLNFIFQLGWITVQGEDTEARKPIGDPNYVAPSWSWASIDAPVQPRGLLQISHSTIALAEARGAEVALVTDFAFGLVHGAWVRLWGQLRRVKSGERKPYYSYDPSSMVNSLTDLATGEDLWFSSDTKEGIELITRKKSIGELVWMPLTLQQAAGAIECTSLVLIEVRDKRHADPNNKFIKPGEKVYRRLGTGNVGIIPSKLQEHKLLLSLGTFPSAPLQTGDAAALISGFQKPTTGLEEFVLV